VTFTPQPRTRVKVEVGDRVRAGGSSGTVTLISWSIATETWLVTVDTDRCRRLTFHEDEVLLLERG
jgi:hypothetical protein